MSTVAVITGASSGIGLATTRELAALGWTVVATARRPEAAGALRELAERFPKVVLRTLDVTSDESVDSCIGSVLTDLGAIDLLVNTAGAGHPSTPPVLDAAGRWNSSPSRSCRRRWSSSRLTLAVPIDQSGTVILYHQPKGPKCLSPRARRESNCSG
jgi:NAD(P)-dependent dehydrogenase (short-subunit alcohol dehydrogenase family)